MRMLCPICAGSGVVVTLPKSGLIANVSQEEMLKHADKRLCPSCQGSGEVESGFLARQLGLIKK